MNPTEAGRCAQFVAALWTSPVLTVFNEVMFFSQQCEDNKPADLSCGFKPCQPTANKPKTLEAVSQKNSGLATTKKAAFLSAVFVYLHGAVGLEFV